MPRLAILTTKPVPTTAVARMQCHALTRDRRALRADPEAECGKLLGWASTAVRFVKAATHGPPRPDEYLWVRCARCKTWNCFEAVVA